MKKVIKKKKKDYRELAKTIQKENFFKKHFQQYQKE